MGLNTVMPPQKSGPAVAESMASGNGVAQPVATDPVGKAAVTTDHGSLSCSAEIVIADETLGTGHAAVGKPAQAHAVAHLDALHLRTRGHDRARDFVPADQRVGRRSPIRCPASRGPSGRCRNG